MIDWLDYFSGIVVGVLALVWLFEGSRQLALHGVRKGAVRVLIGGLFFSAMVSGIAYIQHRMAAGAIQTLNQPVFGKLLPLPENWGAGCCENTREAESRSMVQAAFIESGVLHTYFDSAGKRIQYAPSEKDIKEREARAISDARMEDASRARLSEAINALIAGLLALLLGAGMGYEQRKPSANSTAEPGERKSDARGSP